MQKATKVMERRFVGKQGSMGYDNGTVYTLYIATKKKLKWLGFHKNGWLKLVEEPTVLRAKGNGSFGMGYCPYASWQAFEDNWEALPEPSTESVAA
ncbi:MAG: hypothetical protein JSS66_06385 [Armatimonadetes bacterium]|nr:hypothetical protein [Armatimonadota bacterium]